MIEESVLAAEEAFEARHFSMIHWSVVFGACQTDPTETGSSLERAEMLHRFGEEEPALAEVQKSLELSPNSIEAWRLKGELLSKLKRVDDHPAAHPELRPAGIEREDSTARSQRQAECTTQLRSSWR